MAVEIATEIKNAYIFYISWLLKKEKRSKLGNNGNDVAARG